MLECMPIVTRYNSLEEFIKEFSIYYAIEKEKRCRRLNGDIGEDDINKWINKKIKFIVENFQVGDIIAYCDETYLWKNGGWEYVLLIRNSKTIIKSLIQEHR